MNIYPTYGQEDKNHNGRIDPGEGDPNNAMSKPDIAIPGIVPLLLGD